MELVVTDVVLARVPPLKVTVAPLTAAPLAVLTVPLIFPAVEMEKFNVVLVPALTVAVVVRGNQPDLLAVTL